MKQFGFSDFLYDERQKLIDHPDDFAAFRAQGFRWLVLAPRDTLARQAVERWAVDGRAEHAVDFPPLAIYRLR